MLRVHDYAFLAPATGLLPSLQSAASNATKTNPLALTAAGARVSTGLGDAKHSTAAIATLAPPLPPPSSGAFALILLNSPSAVPPTSADSNNSLFPHLWSTARVRLCADGASSRLYHHFPAESAALRKQFVPHVIVGDLDSSTKQILDFYKLEGTEIKHWTDDDTTDLDKCLATIRDRKKTGDVLYDVSSVVVYGAFGGRFDHTIACIQSLHKAADFFDRLILVSDDNIAELLLPGKHEIRCHPRVLPALSTAAVPSTATAVATATTASAPPVSVHAPIASATPPPPPPPNSTPTPTPTPCGLLPIGSAVQRVSTTGLKWNLHNQPLAFSALISTSNIIAWDVICVDTSHAVLWTASPHVASEGKPAKE